MGLEPTTAWTVPSRRLEACCPKCARLRALQQGERRDSNPRPPGPQPGALPTELRPPRDARCKSSGESDRGFSQRAFGQREALAGSQPGVAGGGGPPGIEQLRGLGSEQRCDLNADGKRVGEQT